MERRIEFYSIRARERIVLEISVPLERLTPPAQNVAWVLRSTRRHRDGRDRLIVTGVLTNEQLVRRTAAGCSVYGLLNDGCMWLSSSREQIRRYLSGDPGAEAELRTRYLENRLRSLQVYDLLDKHPHSDWTLPPLRLRPEATAPEDIDDAVEYLEELTDKIRCAGGDTDNIEGAHRAVINGDQTYLSEQTEAEVDRISRALFGGEC
ncbi:MAG: hypothetical protein Q8R28_24070 [Dehalococcoidia bacterium]|nr:hypothetical protein [Dehalococcoidia bacterium]